MIVSHRRDLSKPSNICHKGITINLVANFKLLGVTIDERLNFNDYISSLAKTINQKLYSIKRIFYLSFSVKLQFFKSFIMPHFDYCLSLAIYFSKQAITRLAKAYYNCLNKLLKINFINKSTDDIERILQKDNLHSFHHRLVFKLSKFGHDMKNNSYSPIELKNSLLPSTKDQHYELRQSSIRILSQEAKTSYGDWTFQNFFAKFYNELGRELYQINDVTSFKRIYSTAQTTIVSTFSKTFTKFDITINFFL
jgi:hypothetical protein